MCVRVIKMMKQFFSPIYLFIYSFICEFECGIKPHHVNGIKSSPQWHSIEGEESLVVDLFSYGFHAIIVPTSTNTLIHLHSFFLSFFLPLKGDLFYSFLRDDEKPCRFFSSSSFVILFFFHEWMLDFQSFCNSIQFNFPSFLFLRVQSTDCKRHMGT